MHKIFFELLLGSCYVGHCLMMLDTVSKTSVSRKIPTIFLWRSTRID